jgi:hypothetical protein
MDVISQLHGPATLPPIMISQFLLNTKLAVAAELARMLRTRANGHAFSVKGTELLFL